MRQAMRDHGETSYTEIPLEIVDLPLDFLELYVAGRREQEAVTRDATYLTKEEAAQRARVSARTIQRAIHDGELRSTGGRQFPRIKPEWVDDWLDRLGQRDDYEGQEL